MDKEDKQIKEPFDPSLIDVDVATVNLGSIIDMLRYEEIDLQPDFQRSMEVWNKGKKSRLIESILLGLPLPSFYFSEDAATKKLYIIDGLQRLCAIKDFILNEEEPLVLEKLQFLKDFEGKKYADLTRGERRMIDQQKITTNTLRKSTPAEVKFVIFQRINSAGTPLTAQEMRNALNQGVAAEFIKELSVHPSFLEATGNSISTKRMEDRDYVNRFVAFFNAYKDYNGKLDEFLNSQMGELNRMTEAQRSKIRVSFIKSMECCHRIFQGKAFRKDMGNSSKGRIAKYIFDAVSVNIAWLSDDERSRLIDKADLMRNGMSELLSDSKLQKAFSSGTGQKTNVVLRFDKVKELIKDILNRC